MEMSKEAVRVGTLALIGTVVSTDEPSPEASGPPGGLSSFRAQNEHQDHLPGHPSGQEHTLDTRSKVRMAMLRIIGQLALSGFQDRIKGWGLKYVSVQLTLSTYKLTATGTTFIRGA
ncbi:unnamed protein product [Rangifer tarandus platyrhynchus]|uniref:MROH2B-like HEAT-repeats domain-containing protein n=1 Tax=Rangifer tarandus platyrhynchus TaxID=3082113 RepID=A0ABN8XTZ4_RANTA|nr:unnamed protein product [Rangifer tarandus platyrhynchus]